MHVGSRDGQRRSSRPGESGCAPEGRGVSDVDPGVPGRRDRHHWAVLRTSTTPDTRPPGSFAGI
jgi:hypothetical protein